MDKRTPKIAVLIPAYKPHFISDLFEGLENQTFKNFDVFVSDDSPDQSVSCRIAKLKKTGKLNGMNVHVRNGPKDAYLNHVVLDTLYSCDYDYTHFHLDDDYIFPTFYETHLYAHGRGDFSVSISNRWYSNEDNRPIPRPSDISFGDSNFLYTAISMEVLTNTTLPYMRNWLGELSNSLFKNCGGYIFPTPPASAATLNYCGLLDLGAFLQSAERKNLIYIRDHLSCFRQHKSQTTHQVATYGSRIAVLCWLAYAIKAHDDEFIDDAALLMAVARQKEHLSLRREADDFFDFPLSILSSQDDLQLLKQRFLDFWVSFLQPRLTKIISSGYVK